MDEWQRCVRKIQVLAARVEACGRAAIEDEDGDHAAVWLRRARPMIRELEEQWEAAMIELEGKSDAEPSPPTSSGTGNAPDATR